jgi:hypothetical protein
MTAAMSAWRRSRTIHEAQRTRSLMASSFR